MILWCSATCYQKESLIVLLMQWLGKLQTSADLNHAESDEQFVSLPTWTKKCKIERKRWDGPNNKLLLLQGLPHIASHYAIHIHKFLNLYCNKGTQLLMLTMRALLQLRALLHMRHWLGSVTTVSMFLMSCSRCVFWGFCISIYSSILSLLRSPMIDW